MGNTKEFKPSRSYMEISSATGSVFVSEGSVLLTIQSSQPNKDAPVMALLKRGDNKPIKVSAGMKLYAINTDHKEAVLSYTELV